MTKRISHIRYKCIQFLIQFLIFWMITDIRRYTIYIIADCAVKQQFVIIYYIFIIFIITIPVGGDTLALSVGIPYPCRSGYPIPVGGDTPVGGYSFWRGTCRLLLMLYIVSIFICWTICAFINQCNGLVLFR